MIPATSEEMIALPFVLIILAFSAWFGLFVSKKLGFASLPAKQTNSGRIWIAIITAIALSIGVWFGGDDQGVSLTSIITGLFLWFLVLFVIYRRSKVI